METHLNYWRISGSSSLFSRNNKEDFLEIGVLLTGSRDISSVNIFLPLDVSGLKVSDLGESFSDEKLVQGIFNEVLTCSRPGGRSRWIELVRQSRDLFCRVHIFARDGKGIDQSELSIENGNGGTLIKIKKPALEATSRGLGDSEKVYFRIRVLAGSKKKSPFVKVIAPKDRFFQSGFDEIEYIDFRLNESRTLPDRIDRLMVADAQTFTVPISLVAFLTAVPVRSELSVSNTAFHKNRLLEEEIWRSYTPGPLPKGMMVYHWKKMPQNSIGIDNFAAFVKLQTRRSGWLVILIYLVVAFAFGVFGNLSASWIQAKFGWPAAADEGKPGNSVPGGAGPGGSTTSGGSGQRPPPPGSTPSGTLAPSGKRAP